MDFALGLPAVPFALLSAGSSAPADATERPEYNAHQPPVGINGRGAEGLAGAPLAHWDHGEGVPKPEGPPMCDVYRTHTGMAPRPLAEETYTPRAATASNGECPRGLRCR